MSLYDRRKFSPLFRAVLNGVCSTALEQQGYSCVLTTCSNDTTAMNLYQAQYIISVGLVPCPLFGGLLIVT